jgi:outer membrane cobalamin receptor
VDTEPTSRSNENSNEKEGAKSSSFRLAQANQGVVQKSYTVGSDVQSISSSAQNSPQLTEIIVTAQKKGEERLQDVPVPISVIDAAALADSGQVQLRDYYAQVPGLSLTTGGGYNAQALIIRGVSTGSGTPTVALTIDGVPFGGSTDYTTGQALPDIDRGDLARIEILRGPQGTLYGASSMERLPTEVALTEQTRRFKNVQFPGGVKT